MLTFLGCVHTYMGCTSVWRPKVVVKCLLPPLSALVLRQYLTDPGTQIPLGYLVNAIWGFTDIYQRA